VGKQSENTDFQQGTASRIIPISPAESWDLHFDSSQTPHIAASQIWKYFDLSSSTMQAKSKQIRDLFGMYPMDPDWSIPSMVEKNPLIWMLARQWLHH